MRTSLKALVVSLGLLVPGAAMAASSAVVTGDLNVRTGPGPGYQRYGTIPAGDEVTVYGCLAGYNWCDVDWAGGRGWVSGNYLLTLGRQYYRRPLSSVGVYVGVPVLGFDPYDYHRRYYTGRSWYHDRYLDGPRRGPDRRDFRGPPREDRYDGRDGGRYDRRDDRRDDRFDARRDDRRDRGDERFGRRGDGFERGDNDGRRDNDGRGNDRFDNDRFDPRRGPDGRDGDRFGYRGDDGDFRDGRRGPDGDDRRGRRVPIEPQDF